MTDIQDLSPIDNNNQANWPEGTMVINQINDAGRADEGLMSRWHLDWQGAKASTGSASAYGVASSRTIANYYDGLSIAFRANHANTGNCTLAVSGLVPKPLRDSNGEEIPAGFIQPDQPVWAWYNSSLDEFRNILLFSALPADSVGTPQIKDKAVTLPKMADGTQGGVLYYGASGVIAELAPGTAGQALITGGAGADPAWGTAGRILQIQYTKFAEASDSTSIPDDNTVPTIAEGTQVWTQAITPTAATNKIWLSGSFHLERDAANFIIFSLFRDTTCIFGGYSGSGATANDPKMSSISVVDDPATTSEVTYSLRVGHSSNNPSGTWRFCRRSAAVLGGVMDNNTMTVSEISA